MAKLFTSDLHHEHNNIFKFSNRDQETTPETHTQWLIDKWNSQVTSGDTVYHLGDLSFARSTDRVIDFVSQLNGSIHLIKGNHDDDTRLNTIKKACRNVVWVGDYIEVKLKSKTKACLFHYPITAWNQQGYGSYHLHGHCHGNLSNIEGRILDVGLDSSYNIYSTHRLFTEDDIEFLMSERDISTPDHHKVSKESPCQV
jgi:calcineurin-like phosphoesterase family protein